MNAAELCLRDLEIQMRLADGFIAGVEQRRGLGAIPRASAFLLAGFGVFDVEHAASLATVEDVTTFHKFRLSFCPKLMRLNAALGVSATPNGQRSPSSRVIAGY